MSSSSTENLVTRRKSAASHNKELCAFCQEAENMGVKIKKVADNSTDSGSKDKTDAFNC